MSPHFIGTLQLDPEKDGVNYRLGHPFAFWSEPTGQIAVPKGFETDLASIPQIFWSMGLAPTGKYDDAAVVHDYLYRTHIFKRKVADWVLLIGMEIRGVPRWKQVAMYFAVRLFGGKAWADDARRIAYVHHTRVK